MKRSRCQHGSVKHVLYSCVPGWSVVPHDDDANSPAAAAAAVQLEPGRRKQPA